LTKVEMIVLALVSMNQITSKLRVRLLVHLSGEKPRGPTQLTSREKTQVQAAMILTTNLLAEILNHLP
jgi:hypothetical protein